MKWRIYRESNEEVDIKKLLKLNGVTKLPAGTKFSGTKASWEKHRGHAGSNTIHKMCVQLEHAGWKRGDWTTGGIPDGSSVANRQTYTSPDGKILMSYTEYYGCTSYDNSFYITFKLAESPANESDDWVGDDGGVDDDINPKFADLRDAFDKIDDRGFQWSSGKWRIRPDELGYDWKIYYDGEGWIGTVNYKTREYDVWNTKVVKKHEIKDFLHACAADSFKPMDTVSESTIKGAGRVVFEDDLVAVYTPDGKLEYKGLLDDCPYKNDDMRYDKTTMTYRIEGPNGDYRTMAKLAESSMNESSRFGFNVGDEVELKSDVEPSRFSDRGAVPAGTVGEVVAVDKPMRGVIKVKIEDGTVVSVPERKLKFAGTDNEPWKTLAAKRPPEPKRDVRPERPEDYYMRPTTYGSPRYTGD